MPIGAADTWFSYFFFAQRGQGYLSYLFFLPIGASDTCLFFFPPIAHRGLGYLQWFTLCLKFGPSVEWIHFLTRLVFGPSGPRIPARIIFFFLCPSGPRIPALIFFLGPSGLRIPALILVFHHPSGLSWLQICWFCGLLHYLQFLHNSCCWSLGGVWVILLLAKGNDLQFG